MGLGGWVPLWAPPQPPVVFGCSFLLWFFLGDLSGPFVAPCRPASGMSSVEQAPAAPSACGSEACGCAPRWAGKERSATRGAARCCRDLLGPQSGRQRGSGASLPTECFCFLKPLYNRRWKALLLTRFTENKVEAQRG